MEVYVVPGGYGSAVESCWLIAPAPKCGFGNIRLAFSAVVSAFAVGGK